MVDNLRIRKVKCDEARPSCYRCLSTGRICEGYGVWGGGGGNGSRQKNSCIANVPILRGERPSPPNISTLIDGSVLSSLPLHVISADEQIYMEWFIHRTAQKLPGAFRLAFWDELLPQACLSEPSVLHAVLSLGSVHKRQALDIRSTSGSSKGESTEVFALQQYTRAISDLRRRMEDKSKLSTKVALITCAIFVQLEYLRGFYKTALTHLRHGLIMLEEILPTNGKVEENNQDVVNEWIMQVFTTMIVQAKLFGQEICQPRLFSLIAKRIRSVSETFQSLSHARQSLECIFFRIMILKNEHERYTESFLADRSPHSELTYIDACTSIQIDLDNWLRACEQVTCESKKTDAQPAASVVDRFAWKLLEVYHTLAQIMAAECFSTESLAANAKLNPSTLSEKSAACSSIGAISSYSISSASRISQQCTDNPSPRSSLTDEISNSLASFFDSIIAQCDVLFKWAFGPSIQTARLHRRPADRDNSHAIADIGWIPPIYYVAIHCSDPRIRSKAIKMLRLVPHREGIWDSLMAATIAEKVPGIEQGRQSLSKQGQRRDLHEKAAVSNSVPESASSLESEKCRMRDVRVELPEGPNGKLVLSYSVSGNRNNDCILGRHIYDLRSSCWTDCPC